MFSYRLWYSDLWCTNDTKFEEFKLKKPFDLIIISVQCCTINSYIQSKIYKQFRKHNNYYIYIHFYKPCKALKFRQFRFYLKFASVQQIHWIGRETDSYNQPTHQPASRTDWHEEQCGTTANSSTTQWGLKEIID